MQLPLIINTSSDRGGKKIGCGFVAMGLSTDQFCNQLKSTKKIRRNPDKWDKIKIRRKK